LSASDSTASSLGGVGALVARDAGEALVEGRALLLAGGRLGALGEERRQVLPAAVRLVELLEEDARVVVARVGVEGLLQDLLDAPVVGRFLDPDVDGLDLQRDPLAGVARALGLGEQLLEALPALVVHRADEALEVGGPRVVRHELERGADAQRRVALLAHAQARVGHLEVEVGLALRRLGHLQLEAVQLEDQLPVLLPHVDRPGGLEGRRLLRIELERALVAQHRLLELAQPLLEEPPGEQRQRRLGARLAQRGRVLLEPLDEREPAAPRLVGRPRLGALGGEGHQPLPVAHLDQRRLEARERLGVVRVGGELVAVRLQCRVHGSHSRAV
jgi:hypothetical protein